MGAFTYQPCEEDSGDENANEAISKPKPKKTVAKKRKAESEESDYDIFDDNKVQEAFQPIHGTTSSQVGSKKLSKKSKIAEKFLRLLLLRALLLRIQLLRLLLIQRQLKHLLLCKFCI